MSLWWPTVAAAPASQGGPAAEASRVVEAFYTYHFRHDMALTPRGLAARRRWIDPALYGELRDQMGRDRKSKEAPVIDGDPFTNSQEYPTSFEIGEARVSEGIVRVAVVLVWPSERRTISVEVFERDNRWRIRDIRYDQTSSLRDLLFQNATRKESPKQ